MSNYSENGVQFTVGEVGIATGGMKIGRAKYSKDGNNNILGPQKIINAIDIDWNNAEVEGIESPINSTAQLLKILGELYSGTGGSGGSDGPGGGNYNGPNIIILSPEEYEALEAYEKNALYFITGDIEEEEGPQEAEDPYSIQTNLQINGNTYTEDGTITLSPSQTYNISGTLRGNIVIDATTSAAASAIENNTFEYTNLILNNVKILSTEDFGIIYRIPEKGKGYKGISVTIEKNSFNYIICTKTYENSEDEQSGCIYSMNNLNIQGAGYLAVKNDGGHGIRGKETTLANLHYWCDSTHDGIHGKNVNIIGGTYYFEKCNDAVGTADNIKNDTGHILFFDGKIKYNTLNGQLLDSKKVGIYFDESLLSENDLLNCTNMNLISENKFYEYIRNYSVISNEFTGCIVKSYSNTNDYKKLQNGQTVTLSPVSIKSRDNQITCMGYNITSPMISIKGYLDKPLYFNSIFNENIDAEITLDNAYICNDTQNFHTIYYDPASEKGKVKIKAYNDSINIISNNYYNNETLVFECDAIKSENNIEVEANAGSLLYINSNMCDGIDGQEVKISDTKGSIIVSNCGQRGIKGNAIVIGPDAVISKGNINSYVTDTSANNYKKVEGLVYSKNNCQLYNGEGSNITGNTDDSRTNTGMADIFARNGKSATKGNFGTTNNELEGYLITSSMGAIKSINLGNAAHLYYNFIYSNESDTKTGDLLILNDPGASTETYFAKNIYNSPISND